MHPMQHHSWRSRPLLAGTFGTLVIAVTMIVLTLSYLRSTSHADESSPPETGAQPSSKPVLPSSPSPAVEFVEENLELNYEDGDFTADSAGQNYTGGPARGFQPGPGHYRPVIEMAYADESRTRIVPYTDPESGETRTRVETYSVKKPVQKTRYVWESGTPNYGQPIPPLGPHAWFHPRPDSPADQKVSKLVDELRALDERDRVDSEQLSELRDALTEQFEQRHQQQAGQIEATEKRLQELKELHAQRDQRSEEIVRRRIDELLGQPDPLRWELDTPTTSNLRRRPAGLGQQNMQTYAEDRALQMEREMYQIANEAKQRAIRSVQQDIMLKQTAGDEQAQPTQVVEDVEERRETRIRADADAPTIEPVRRDASIGVAEIVDAAKQVRAARRDLEVSKRQLESANKIERLRSKDIATGRADRTSNSATTNAQSALEFAKIELDAVAERLKAQERIALARLDSAQSLRANAQHRFESGELRTDELRAREAAVTEARLQLDAAKSNLKLFEKASQIAELEAEDVAEQSASDEENSVTPMDAADDDDAADLAEPEPQPRTR